MKRGLYILILIYTILLSCSNDDKLLDDKYVRGVRLTNNYAEKTNDDTFLRYILNDDYIITGVHKVRIKPSVSKKEDTISVKKEKSPEKKPKEKTKKIKKKVKKEIESDSIEIKYRRYHFIGLPQEVTNQIVTLPKREGFDRLIQQQEATLEILEEKLISREDIGGKVYKDIAIDYLVEIDNHLKFVEFYNERLYDAYLKLVIEAKQLDRSIEEEYNTVYGRINSSTVKDSLDVEKLVILEKKYTSHKELLQTLLDWNLKLEDFQNSTNDFKILKDRNIAETFEMYKNKTSQKEVIHYLEIRLADLFHNAMRSPE
ncbi:hypothetical protein IWQ47_000815 [Aquimarina sp. EL_43]|uniref:hypothetical protein n=1 Tax=unclassified Aquimarina TaxID=2627091 RepID=UPI0018CAC60E|nr:MULTISPECIES: hypothetical protein [unclassified Aquimarina]MBG6129883.1 hypothetical protein [Aquimarina sp. EL_35]MBG6150948.1 hypothetical protein [Aquimarina sp. EL_32]MBG6167745.1 hypothetical protein [Aquimarina sp. EL_43]